MIGKIRLILMIPLMGLISLGSCSQRSREEARSKQQNGKWLPVKSINTSLAPEVDNFLESLNGSMRLLYCNYDSSLLQSRRSFKDNVLEVDGDRWSSSVKANPVQGEPAMDLDVQFRLEQGEESSAGVAVAFDFEGWSTDNYVLLPASVYNGNRCKILDQGYNEDIPRMSVPIPQLSPNPDEVSRLEVNACNLATPAMCFYSKSLKRAFMVLAEQQTRYADNGFMVEESADREEVSFVISAPGVREKRPLFVGFEESPDRGADLKAGEEITLRMRIYFFETPNIPGLLEKFMAERKKVTGPNHPRNLIPFSQVADWMTQRIDERWYTNGEYQFYYPENANWISFGWIGGLMNTFPMLALGDEFHYKRVERTFDFTIPRGQGESGYFFNLLNYDGKRLPGGLTAIFRKLH